MRSGSETASISTVSDPHLSMIVRVFPGTPNGCEEGLLLGGAGRLRKDLAGAAGQTITR